MFSPDRQEVQDRTSRGAVWGLLCHCGDIAGELEIERGAVVVDVEAVLHGCGWNVEDPLAVPATERTRQDDGFGFVDREILNGSADLFCEDDPTALNLAGSADAEVAVGLGEATVLPEGDGGRDGMIPDGEDAGRDQGPDAADEGRPGKPEPAIVRVGKADALDLEGSRAIIPGGDCDGHTAVECTGGSRARA